jgi:hypothetical protein
MPTSEYEMTVWKNYNVSEEIFQEDGKGETKHHHTGRMEE